MPELPEVETVCLALRKLTLGLTIRDYVALRRDYLRLGHEWTAHIQGGRIDAVQRKGKILALNLHNGLTLLHHLGMSGRLLFFPACAEIEKHTHVRIHLDEIDFDIRHYDPRRFGYAGICWTEQLDRFEPWGMMGADPLSVKPKHLYGLLQGRVRPIKPLLLEQHILGGLGNIYADEALFRAEIHPTRSARAITCDECRRLVNHIRKVLHESIAAGGSSTSDYQKLDGTLGAFQHQHQVYNRTGQPCKRCGALIEKIVLSGRGTHFCPMCQK